MMDKLEEALTRLGYRRPDVTIDPNRWAKPHGFSVFIVTTDEPAAIGQWFYGTGSITDLVCWKHEPLHHEANNTGDFFNQIARFEEWNTFHGGKPTNFGFLDREQLTSKMLGSL